MLHRFFVGANLVMPGAKESREVSVTSQRGVGRLCLLTLLISTFQFGEIAQAVAAVQGEEPVQATPVQVNATQFETGEPPRVKRIVFFDSGVAQIVHQGVVEGNQQVELRFPRNQVDDVLKSLVFDNETGTTEAVQYRPAPSRESLAADALGPPMTLAQTLQSFRGERVLLTIQGQVIDGQVLSVETRQLESRAHEVVNLLTTNGLQTFPLDEITATKFASEKIQAKFQLAMVGLQRERESDSEPLLMYFRGDGQRKVQLGYVVDAPLWKVTYRLNLDDDQSELQGWAHIDNATGFDWDNVYVDLRSGRPRAFNVELFDPVIGQRNQITMDVFGFPTDLNLVRPFYGLNLFTDTAETRPGMADYSDDGAGSYFGFGMGGGVGGLGGGGFGGGGGGFGGGGGGFGGGVFGAEDPEEAADARQVIDIGGGIESAAKQGRAAEMLQFEIKRPLTLPAGNSAMVPLIEQQIETQLLTRFRLSDGSDDSAIQGDLIARAKNGDQFSLPAGPVSVYRSGGFSGDTILGRCETGEQQDLVYGVDRATEFIAPTSTITTTPELVRFETPPHKIVVERLQRTEHPIVLKNADTQPRQILLQANVAPGSRITTEPTRMVERTAEFDLELAAGETLEMTIAFEKSIEDTLVSAAVKPADLAQWKAEGVKIAPEVTSFVDRLFAAVEQYDELMIKRERINSQIRQTESEQTRITRMITAVGSAPAAQEFIEQLRQGEVELKQLRVDLESASAEFELSKKRLETLRNNPLFNGGDNPR